MITTRTLLLAAAALLPLQSVSAQQQDNSAEEGTATNVKPSDDFHDEIVIRAPGLTRLDMLAGTSVVQGAELQRNLNGQLGEVLAKLPGVSATGFAPGVSRPILRGFGGERVRVLTDGIGAIDASSTSDDHAVTVDPLIADRIEVLRGPAVLLYGSQAIGGAVNVITKRIPPGVPDEPVHIDAQAALDTASNRREGGLSVDMPLGANVAFHVDGSWRKTDDLEIPGYVASESLRADLLALADEEEEEGHLEEAEEFREGANTRGTLPNSWTETYTLGTGIAFFSGESNLGISFDYYDTNYGIPGLPGVGHVHEHDEGGEEEEGEEEAHEEEGPVSIGMQRYRVDLRGALDLGDGFFDQLQTRWGYQQLHAYRVRRRGNRHGIRRRGSRRTRGTHPVAARCLARLRRGRSIRTRISRRSGKRPSFRAMRPTAWRCLPCRSSISIPSKWSSAAVTSTPTSTRSNRWA